MVKRRGNREGTLYRRSDGRWEARLTLPDGTRKSFYAKTQAEARRKLSTAVRNVDEGMPVPGEKLTVAKHLETWLKESVRPSVRPSTFKSYRMHVERHIAPALGAVTLTRLTPGHVRGMINDKLDAGLSPQTVLLIRATLRAALNEALRDGLVTRNVAALADPPKVERSRPPAMTKSHALAIIDAVDDHRLAPLYVFALATGMRQGEILGLVWDDVDLDAGVVTVRFALQRIDGELRRVPPKSKTAERSIPLSGTAKSALWRQRNQQAQERETTDDWHDTGFVFTTNKGEPLDASVVTHMLRRQLESAGVERVTFHQLRHGFATLMLAEGINPRIVQEALGHSQIGLTLGTYSHVPTELLRDAVDRLDDVLSGAR